MMAFARRLLLGLLPFAMLACSDGSDGDGDGTGRVSIVLTDAPGDIRAAVVTIDEIYLQGSDGRTVLRDRDTTVNLLTLANDAATIVDQAIVPAGSYEQLRFVISGAYIEVEGDGGGSEIYATSPDYAGLPAGAVVTGELQAPSLGQSGLKVQLGGDDSFVVTEDAAIVLVDFDVSQSFGHQAGNSGRWVMHPVIKGATITTAATVVVNVALGSGVTLPDIGGNPTTLAAFNATVTNSGSTTETLQLSDPESDGTWTATFNYLLPGTYSVGVTPPAGMTITTDPVLPVSVNAASGTTETVSVTVTSATVPSGLAFALGFDADQHQFAEIPDSPSLDLSSDWTIEAWVWQETTSANLHIISKWGTAPEASYELEADNGVLRLGTNNGVNSTTVLVAPTAMPVQAWTHAAATFSGGIAHLFVNGTEVTQGPMDEPANSAKPLSLGREGPPLASRYFDGRLDEIRIWNVARTQSQIMSTMSTVISAPAAGLIGYWRLDEGTGQTIHDLSGSGNDGLLGGSVAADASDPTWLSSSAPVQ